MMLGSYLKAAAAMPWKPAEHDCTAFPARWASIPLVPYSTDEEGQALIAEAGGLLPLWSGVIGDRLRRVTEPRAGDVGIINVIGLDGKVCEVGAIFTGKRWAFVPKRGGIASAAALPVAVWRV